MPSPRSVRVSLHPTCTELRPSMCLHPLPFWRIVCDLRVGVLGQLGEASSSPSVSGSIVELSTGEKISSSSESEESEESDESLAPRRGRRRAYQLPRNWRISSRMSRYSMFRARPPHVTVPSLRASSMFLMQPWYIQWRIRPNEEGSGRGI